MGILSRLFGAGTRKVMPIHVDDGTFAQEVGRSALPVVLDVWSPGCGPCKMMEPIIVELATRYEGRVKVAEMNAAESGATTARLGVRATPTILFFKGRRLVEQVSGFVGERYLSEIVDTELLGLTEGRGR